MLPQASIVVIGWKPSERGWLKLTINGSCDENGHIAAGGFN